MRRPRRLRTQISLAAAAVVMVVVALAGLVITVRSNAQDRAQVDRQLRARVGKVEADAEKGGRTQAGQAKDDGDANLLAGTESLTRVLSGDAVVTERGEGVAAGVMVPVPDGLTTITIEGRPWRSLVRPTDAVPDGRLQVLQSLAPVEQRVEDNRRLAAAVAGAATVATGLLVWLIAGLVLRPLDRLRQGAAAIRPGGGQQLPLVEQPEEIAELSATLNGMLDRLQRSMEATRRFTADAGHELRTPLTSLGMDIETLRRRPAQPDADRRRTLDALAREHARIVALLDGLQRLARGDAEALPERTAVAVDDAVAAALDAAQRRHPDVRYVLESSANAVVSGWPDGVRLALDNLLDNAALHGRPCGQVDVSISDTDPVTIRVVDDGPGIPPEERERLIGRFARGADPRSPGSGLGLALVDQQARLHGGALRIEDAPSGGAAVVLELPAT